MSAQTLGIDFSLARPDPRAVAAAGYRFVMGYLSYNPPKNLTAAQVAAYRAAGLQVGLVWETTEDRALAGASAGASDGAAAEGQANAVGYPPGSVLFAAVDFAATLAQIDGPIRAYMAAFSAATRRPVGVYGSYDVVSRLCTPGKPPVSYAWQTMAWSSSRLWQPGHLFQRLAHTYSIAGAPIAGWDENVLLNPLPLFGANMPAPTPAPTPAPEADMQPGDMVTFTNWDTGETKEMSLEALLSWIDVWAQRATAAATASNAGVAALAQLIAAGHADLSKDEILATIDNAIRDATVNVDVNVGHPPTPPPAAS